MPRVSMKDADATASYAEELYLDTGTEIGVVLDDDGICLTIPDPEGGLGIDYHQCSAKEANALIGVFRLGLLTKPINSVSQELALFKTIIEEPEIGIASLGYANTLKDSTHLAQVRYMKLLSDLELDYDQNDYGSIEFCFERGNPNCEWIPIGERDKGPEEGTEEELPPKLRKKKKLRKGKKGKR